MGEDGQDTRCWADLGGEMRLLQAALSHRGLLSFLLQRAEMQPVATRTSQPGTSMLVLRFGGGGRKETNVHLFTRNNFVRCVKLSGQNDKQKERNHPADRKSLALFHSWCYEMAQSHCTWKTLYKSMATGSWALKLLE